MAYFSSKWSVYEDFLLLFSAKMTSYKKAYEVLEKFKSTCESSQSFQFWFVLRFCNILTNKLVFCADIICLHRSSFWKQSAWNSIYPYINNNKVSYLTHWPIADWVHENFWNCSKGNATEALWWLVNIGWCNGLVPSGNKLLPEPILT